jgi:hypothetical protein
MSHSEAEFRSYLRVSGLVAGLTFVVVFVTNSLCDPLWNVDGNRLFPANYAFNERHSKTNLYLRVGRERGCVIFGSSRATLLDAGRLGGLRCFNYSFSAGTPREFVHFARYVMAKGRQPELVVVGVDGRNFSRSPLALEVPDFVRDLGRPPGVLETYLSLRTTDFSLRTIARDSPWPRYYTEDFTADVLPHTPPYRPPSCFNSRDHGRRYTLENRRYYEELLQLLRPARAIGYVPPISAWDIATLDADGTLDSYVETLYSTAELFDRFYDFSIPSAVTRDPGNTYDGDHYSREVNAGIVRALDRGSVSFGLAVHQLSLAAYKEAFKSAIAEFLRAERFSPVFSEQCPYVSAVR